MKTLLSITALTLFISIQSWAQNENSNPDKNQDSQETLATVIVANEEELDDYVGQLITIKGEVSNTKIPQILGVDVASDTPDLRGEIAIATGILETWFVTEDEVDNTVANRGAGTFYRLTDKESKFEVQVQKPN
jgi:hypothetical protein